MGYVCGWGFLCGIIVRFGFCVDVGVWTEVDGWLDAGVSIEMHIPIGHLLGHIVVSSPGDRVIFGVLVPLKVIIFVVVPVDLVQVLPDYGTRFGSLAFSLSCSPLSITPCSYISLRSRRRFSNVILSTSFYPPSFPRQCLSSSSSLSSPNDEIPSTSSGTTSFPPPQAKVHGRGRILDASAQTRNFGASQV